MLQNNAIEVNEIANKTNQNYIVVSNRNSIVNHFNECIVSER